MSTRRPDKALRRMVAELAAATPQDVEAVLDELDTTARKRVKALLADYRGEVVPLPMPLKPAVAPVVIEGLSPWLAVRLERSVQTVSARPGSLGETSATEARELGVAYSMTQTAFEALRRAAAAMQQEPAPAPWPGPVRKALLGRRAAR